MNVLDLSPLLLSCKLALITTFILYLVGIPLSYLLIFKKFPLKSFLEIVVTLPIILPPSVLGFYLLVLFNPNSGLGQFFDKHFGIQFIFSFYGLIIGSSIFSLPFMINSLVSSFESLPFHYIESAYVLGKSPLKTFLSIVIPNRIGGIITGGILTFAHSMGEFGVVLMIGGDIPGKTRVASISIYNQIEALNYSSAHFQSLCLLFVSCIFLLLIKVFNKKNNNVIRVLQ